MVKSKVDMSLRSTIKTIRDYDAAKGELVRKLRSIDVYQTRFPTSWLKAIADDLGVTRPTVVNYLSGDVKDGYLGELIYELVTDYISKNRIEKQDKKSAKKV